jgi:hypothetical protein
VLDVDPGVVVAAVVVVLELDTGFVVVVAGVVMLDAPVAVVEPAGDAAEEVVALAGVVGWPGGGAIPVELVAAAAPAGVSIAGSDDRKPEAFGWWMLVSARRRSAPGWTPRKLIADGSGITMPITAARRSMR